MSKPELNHWYRLHDVNDPNAAPYVVCVIGFTDAGAIVAEEGKAQTGVTFKEWPDLLVEEVTAEKPHVPLKGETPAEKEQLRQVKAQRVNEERNAGHDPTAAREEAKLDEPKPVSNSSAKRGK